MYSVIPLAKPVQVYSLIYGSGPPKKPYEEEQYLDTAANTSYIFLNNSWKVVGYSEV